jgi:predicted ATPase with chaperone activity
VRDSIETERVVVARANCHVTYPARMKLIAAVKSVKLY